MFDLRHDPREDALRQEKAERQLGDLTLAIVDDDGLVLEIAHLYPAARHPAVVRRHRGNQLVSPELGDAHPLGLNRQGQQTEVDLSADEPRQRGSGMPARDAQVDLRQAPLDLNQERRDEVNAGGKGSAV